MIGFLKKSSIFCISLLLVLGLPVKSCYAEKFSKDVENYLSKIEKEKDEKFSNLKSLGVKFYDYSFNCPSEELKRRFDEMTKYRWQVYFVNPQDCGIPGAVGIFNEDYKSPENWEELDSRFSYPTGLSYNLAHKKYNAGILIADKDNIFLAIEAPSSKNIERFYELMNKYEIESLVRLNSANEYSEDFYPYWEESKFEQNENIDNSKEKLKIGDNIMDYYHYEWPHKQNADIESISNIAKQVLDSRDGKFMAVSCRAGSGRTGTYICSYLILNELKKQLEKGISSINDISLNIDKIVWEMSIQRPFAVTHFPQYEMLYRLADYHLSKINENILK